MKKILAFILCLMLVCVIPIVASAEDYEVGDVYEGEVPEDNSTPEDETPTEEEILPPEETPEDTPTEETPEEIPSEPIPDETPKEEVSDETPDELPTVTPDVKEEEKSDIKTITAEIAKWLEDNYEWISLVITIIAYGILMVRKLSLVRKSMGTINNNAITIANNSKSAIDEARASIESASGKVTSYEERIVALLEAYKNTAEDKARLENEFLEIRKYLETSTQANMEFANELAELLALANIPNYKKEEIGARHLAAKRHIEEAAAKAVALLPVSSEEVKGDDGEKA